MTPETALSQLLQIETDLSSALGHDNNEASLEETLCKFHTICLQLSHTSAGRPSDVECWTRVARTIQAIQAIAASFAELEQNLLQDREDVIGTVRLMLQKRGSGVTTSALLGEQPDGHETCLDPDDYEVKVALGASEQSQQSLNAVIMRRWMLEHMEHPFPSTQDKEIITEETNRGATSGKGELRPEQATLWFINTRRRSGWTRWARRFANSDKTRLRAIVAAIQGKSLDWSQSGVKTEDVEDSLEELVQAYDAKDRDLTKTELAELCKTEFFKVTEWIEQGSKEKVGDWMDKVVSEAKATLKRKKQDRRAARKLLAERRRGRAAAATKDMEMEESEDELAEERVAPQARLGLGLRPIRRVPQQRNVSGGSSSSSCLSSVVSGRLHPSGSSSSAATSFDSTYERGTSSGRCATDFKAESTGHNFQQMRVNDDQPNIEVCAPSPTGDLSRLPPFTPQQQHRAEQLRSAYEEQQASLAYFQPPASTSWSAPTGAESERYDQRPNDAQTFFMPSVTAAAALGNNWGMPVSSSGVDSGVTEQPEEVANYGGWLAWSGQMMTGEA